MSAAAERRGRALDGGIALLLGAAAFALFAHFGLQLARTDYFSYLNLAFDFDPPFFVNYLTGQPAGGGNFGVSYKHPLWMAFRPFALLFMAGGFPAREAAVLVMALCGGLAVALAYAYVRLARAGRPEAVAAALFFAASSTTLVTAVVIESYGWVNFSLAALWCIYLLSHRSAVDRLWARVVAGTLVAGVTITNVMQALIAEALLLLKRRASFGQALRQLLRYGVLVGLLLTALIALYQPAELWATLQHPVQTAKEVYWQRTKGGTVGLFQLCKTFFVYSFFAPAFDFIKLAPAIDMLDFRSFSFTPGVLLAALAWCLFLAGNVALAWRARVNRVLILSLLGAVLLNLLFHLDYQFRGSLYIYASHLHFPIFALGISAAPWVRLQSATLRLAYTATLLLFAGVALVNNVARVDQWVGLMQQLDVPKNAPEINR